MLCHPCMLVDRAEIIQAKEERSPIGPNVGVAVTIHQGVALCLRHWADRVENEGTVAPVGSWSTRV